MSRIACLHVPDFSIAALIRANPELDSAVLAIAQNLAPHAELSVVAPRARRLGIRPGMTIAQARAVSSELLVAMRSDPAERSAHDALIDAAISVSPVVEPGAPGCVWLGLDGLSRIFADENEIALELIRRARRVGMEPAIGVAANRELAQLAARCGGIRVIDAGREREFIDWLPLDSLDLGADSGGLELEVTLARWGLKRLGELARLDADSLGSRLGRRGVELARRARAADSRPLAARPHAELFAESTELEYGIDTLEPLGFVMRTMLERLAARLELRGLVASEVMLALGLDGHRVASRRVAAPSNDVRAMLTLINLALESDPPAAAVESIRIEITPRAARPAQADMFLPPAPTPERLHTTIARLAALCGPDQVGTLMAENSHRPEAVRLEQFDPSVAQALACDTEYSVARLVLREIRPALEVEVLVSRGAPEFIRGPNLGARVISLAGPWRRDGEWWRCAATDHPSPAPCSASRPQPPMHEGGFGAHPRVASTRVLKSIAAGVSEQQNDGLEQFLKDRGPSRCSQARIAQDDKVQKFIRDYYELALDDGGVYRVFRDARSDRWFLDGMYD